MGSDLALRNRLQEQGLLDRFEARAIAMAEEAGLEYIQLAGELWTRVAELERVKDVEAGDFQRNAGLRRASDVFNRMLPEPLQQLLSVPGVRKVTQPAKFAVEGGYAIHCGGDGASDIGGIWDLVREQRPDWVKAQAIFLNLPLTLAYLQHGASAVAHATRNLTIGTTIDAGKAAANRESATLAVIPFAEGGDPAVTALLLQAVQLMNSSAQRAVARADHAHDRIDGQEQELQAVKQDLKSLAADKSKPRTKRAQAKKADRDLLFSTWEDHYGNLCPRCKHPVRRKDLQVEHWTNREIADVSHVWLTCGACNTELGEPVGNGGAKRTADDERSFRTFQDLLALRKKQAVGVQLILHVA